jgi:prepilin-type N-terminal cleavage/methylation domain-containing protein
MTPAQCGPARSSPIEDEPGYARLNVWCGHADAGFTLVEVIVSLALVVLMLALLPNAIGLGRRAWETHENALARIEIQAGIGLLEQRLAEAMPVVEPGAAVLGQLAFRCGGEGLSFVAPAAGRGDAGGLRRWTLAFVPEGGGGTGRVELRHAPFPDDATVREAPPVIVAARTLGLTVGCIERKRPGEGFSVHADWPHPDVLPYLVAISTPGSSTGHRFLVELKLAGPRP